MHMEKYCMLSMLVDAFFRIYISYPTVSYAFGKCMQSQGLRLKPAQVATAYTKTVVTIYRLYHCNRKTRKNSSITAISKIQLKGK